MPSAGTGIFKGAALTVAMRWIHRLIGFISTLILARLLIPDDFGIVAMATLVIGLADVLLDLGVNVALIQNPNATLAHYNTAWTLRLIQTIVAAAVVVAAAPMAARFFGDSRVADVLPVLALGLVLAGLENIGVVTFQKEMRFGLDFQFMLLTRVAGFLVTVAAAWLMRNYWALIIGSLVSRSFAVLLSYAMHSMRPRLSLEKFKEVFSVSQWILVRSIGDYTDTNLHKTIVGRGAGSTTMGAYSLADEISAMPASEFLTPLNRALFPAFVRAKQDLAELRRLFLLAQGIQTLVTVPACVGLALVASDAVVVLLGDKWLLTVPFLQLLALANVIRAISASGGYVMITLGYVHRAALLSWSRVIIFLVGLVLVPNADALQIAGLRLLTLLGGLALFARLLMLSLRTISLLDITRTTVRPLLGSVAMALPIVTLGTVVETPPIFGLAAKIAIGLLVYPATVMLMWRLAGKPAGPETYVLEKLGFLRGRAPHRRSGKLG